MPKWANEQRANLKKGDKAMMNVIRDIKSGALPISDIPGFIR
jgi:hypothetical protein